MNQVAFSQALLLVAILVASGCSSMPKLRSGAAPATVETTKVQSASTATSEGSIKLSYRTESSRISTLANAIQPASFQQNVSAVPEFTTSRLEIRYPHPAGIPDYATVTVVFQSEAAETKKPLTPASIWKAITRTNDDQATDQPTQAFREVWTLDLPRWQLDSLIAKLRNDNFYARAKVLDANSFLATEIDGRQFGKNYKQVAELDAIILRIRQEGRLLNPGAAVPESIRLPPVN